MFILSELQDIVRIEPHKFSQDMEQKIRDELNKKFANKVSLLKLIFVSTIQASRGGEYIIYDPGRWALMLGRKLGGIQDGCVL